MRHNQCTSLWLEKFSRLRLVYLLRTDAIIILMCNLQRQTISETVSKVLNYFAMYSYIQLIPELIFKNYIALSHLIIMLIVFINTDDYTTTGQLNNI